jgi:hypothetical protein
VSKKYLTKFPQKINFVRQRPQVPPFGIEFSPEKLAETGGQIAIEKGLAQIFRKKNCSK